MLAPPPPKRRLIAITAGGIAAAALVLAVGFAAERIVLGVDEAAFRARVEGEVRASFDEMARHLQASAATLADPARVAAASADDATAARELFDRAENLVDSVGEAELAATIFAVDGTPLAWAGRPSDLPTDRVAGAEAWFFAQGAMGLRLVYVTPVVDQSRRRIGLIAAERTLNEVVPSEPDGAFMYPTRFTRVAIEPMLEAPRTQRDASVFDIPAPNGVRLLTAVVATGDLARARTRWRRATQSLAIIVSSLALLLLCGPLIDWRSRARRPATYAAAAMLIVGAVLGGRALLVVASPADWASGAVLSAAAYASPLLAPLLTSPFDFLVTALASGALVAVGLFAVEAWRMAWRHRRLALTSGAQQAAYALVHLAAGVAVAFVVAGQVGLISDTIANSTIDLFHFSLHPWSPARVALQAGLIVWSASALGLAVLVFRAATIPWRVRQHDVGTMGITALLWASPLLAWLFAVAGHTAAERPLWIALAVAVVLGVFATRLKSRYRHGSQAFRLVMLTGGLVVPALAFYPSLFQTARESKIELVESRYAPQALNQRQTIQQILQDSLQQIDSFPLLNDLVSAAADADDSEALTDRAFQVWRGTGLANYPVTSSVELFGPDGRLVSRFAFNLPDDLSAVARFTERSCEWDVFEEVSPFFAEERRVLHAGRAACATNPDGSTRVVGGIVVHAMLDYANLPFIASQNPYLEMLRPANLQDENLSGGDIDYAVYGWSRTPIYSSDNTAWQLDDETFRRVGESRDARWAQLRRGDELFDVYLTNDRFGIYALGFPVVTPLGHLVNLAELTVLAAGTYVLLLLLHLAFAWLGRRHTSAQALLREVRASFYRKLFLAFVFASVIPVVALAIVARNYVASEMDSAVEDEAVRTAAAARRVVEDLVAPRAAEQGAGIDDNLMVWVSRLIDQDVNIFRGARLQATSERNLFASGLLPTRTPAAVYRGLSLRNEAATVSRERIGTFEYLVAGSPVKARQVAAILTVPLTARQRDIEEQVDLLNRQVLLGALLCILAGAAIGYSLAERIADPVNRLTRATRRIARGELDVRVAATSSDELRRLVQDFNRMAHELQQQRRELERTHRLEAWAEMSRQVAHDIKNPLTPIQLNAEHLRRVHADRGEPLSPVLEECVANILTQVRLLRQIASEFSSFAASPTVKRAAVDLAALIEEIIGPYRTGLAEKIRFDVHVNADLPHVDIDRALIARALTNLIENALHAMPSGGTLTIVTRADDPVVHVRVSDTGRGMDPEALARAFEPYFSTKATGTGLGLPIAKRNVELNGGRIAITTGPGGTTVDVDLPMAERATYSTLR